MALHTELFRGMWDIFFDNLASQWLVQHPIQHNQHECGVYTILFALHLQGGDIDGNHVPQHLRVPHTDGSLNGLRLLILDMILC